MNPDSIFSQQIVGGKMLVEVPTVSEGSTCPTCQRRVPHKKKATSPSTKVVSIRVPIDDVDTFKEMIDAGAEHMKLKDKPHHQYWTLTYALVSLLQGPGGS